MRKLRNDPLSQLDVADVLFNGFFEDESGYFSDPSLYDHDGNTESMNDSDTDDIKNNCIIRNEAHSKPAKFTCKRVNIDERLKLQGQAVGMRDKNKDACILKAGLDSSKGADMVFLQKCPKHKDNSDFRNDGKENLTSSDDSGMDLNINKSMSSRERKNEKLIGNMQESNKSNAVKKIIEIKNVRKRKKLCKAAALRCASKGKEKGQTKDKGALRSVMLDNCNARPSLGVMPRKETDAYTSDSDTCAKDEDECAWAEILGKAKPISRKCLSGKNHDSKAILKHKVLSKYDDLSSISKEVISSEPQVTTIIDGKIKGNQVVKDFCISSETIHSVAEHRKLLSERNGDNGMLGDDVSSGVTEGGDGNREHERGDGSSNADHGARDVGWVSCDSCGKWRCIPASLADSIEESNCIWVCKENPDKKFADCSVPQEKTNSEINADLEITDCSYSEDDEKDPAIDSKFYQSHLQTSWTLIKHNIFLHRRQKALSADEQMVCGCKRPEDGTPGCGEDCLNRMLSIECVAQTCPCGDACSNQQFQKRLYKNVSWFRCGKKGFGLRVLEDVSMGAFIIEYVGEVLDMNAHEARQKEYALRGQKHFYFMRLNSNEVIDACIKGNLGRFVNHSCQPNCRTEKWTVNGEICIGLFALRDLKKGEEITFDYNYVRVSGAVAKKCLCGARYCRGYIGGDPETPISIVESNSDEDDPEPIMIEESSEGDNSWAEGRTEISENITVDKSSLVYREGKSGLGRNVKKDIRQKQIKRKLMATKFGFSKLKMTTPATEGSDEVEDLNKLLDENGGLSKRMYNAEETATCYMKVLALKATESLKETESGYTINAETCRSTRDLSMLLDVILKTQTRLVLLEAMRKNGLQILHGIIKHSKKDYKKTPIVRKALRVLEFLATKRILIPEQINSDPSYGSESLRETTYQLCRHADNEVQKMAHRFRDNWVNPFSIYKPREGVHQSCQQISMRHNQHDVSKKRKRSRWDQPSQEVLDETMAGGLPQIFWPFNAANLVPAINNYHPDQKFQRNQNNTLRGVETCPDLSTSNVVNGIPVVVSQKSSICVGIPVGHFHAPKTPHMLPTYHRIINNADDRGKVSTFNAVEMRERTAHGIEIKPYDHAENHGLMFGNSHYHFFQQMYRLFGTKFHPWQLQTLMAPQSWGPFVSGDARLKIVNASSNFGLPTEPNIRDESIPVSTEPTQNTSGHLEPEPPVPGLSPPHDHGFLPPQPPSENFTDCYQHEGSEYLGKSDPSHERKNSVPWKPRRWNAPRWSMKIHGHKERIIEFQQESYHSQRHQQNFQRKSHNRWGEGSFWPSSNVCTETDTGQYNMCDSNVFDDTDNFAGIIPLEKPWGYGKDYNKEDESDSQHIPVEFPQMRIDNV